MKKLIMALTASSFMTLSANANDNTDGIDVATFTAPSYKPGVVQHIVLFKYKPGVSALDKQRVQQNFLNLQQTATRHGKPYIRAIVSGMQNSLENLHMGFEQGFILTFESEGDRNYYVGTPAVTDPQYFDPQHDAFKKFVGPFLTAGNDGVLVFDFSVTQ